ncbi:MAG TPA: beta-ketoacyl reductase, partial [Actinophytocola sp.]|nr:beta-ketoacyl reductase [Actinophytocola sp.]
LHPALLDAALHAAAYLPGRGGAGAAARLPFAWTGAAFHATGATALRVHLRASGDADVSVELTDATGGPVASIESLSTRAVDLDEVVTRGADLLYRLDWVPVTVPDTVRDTRDDASDDAVLDLTGTPDGSAPERARALVCHALDAVQRHLADAEPDRRLVVLTRHADRDPAMAAVWGLVRTAQSEHPGRFAVVDTDADTEAVLLKSALATDEPQLALHDGAVTAPRLTRHEPTPPSRPLDPAGTVLVTGGTGMLGGLVARRLVTHHEVRHLLLTSRRGEQAPGADRLREELTALGAEVTVAACDLGDRAAVAAMLDEVPAEHPLTAVIHSAAALDDGVVTALDAERVARVFHPKVDGAWYLHDLTQHLDLAAFVLFSSASGTLGNAGQGNYAAANGFLDGLARHRRAAGLPASSLAWGLWERASELTGALLDGSRGHLKQDVAAMTDEEGMRLLDAVLARPDDPAVLVPIKLDLAAMRRSANAPSVVRGLLPAARSTARRTAEQATTTESFVDELRRLTPQRRLDRLVDTVRAYAAATLGHTDHAAIEERQSFRDLGVDSLAAVDLRNRLGAATGLRLPVTLAFDHPDPVALAGHLRDELGLADDSADDTAGESAASIAALAEIDRLEAALEDLLGRDAEDDAAAEAADRLRRLAARWRGGVEPDPEVVTDDDIIRLAEAELDR